MTSKCCFTIGVILGLVFVCTNAQEKVFNVLSYGAKADGMTDDSEAFLNGWRDACIWNGNGTLLIPSGVYMINGAVFKGPCNGSVTTFEMKGVIKAPTDPNIFCNTGSWIAFQYIHGLDIKGHGTFDGQGDCAWGKHQCETLPHTLALNFVHNFVVHDIHSINSKGVHVKVFQSNNARFRHVQIAAPENSPNTDGIHISYSTNMHIADSNIGTGDDCISIIDGSQSINITGITCGPGHGISIGSLGKLSKPKIVKDIHVKNCTLINTQNGVRIKSWASTITGMATNIIFDDITIIKASNPIIIDQHYCPERNCSGSTQESCVQIKDVTFNNIRGSSSSKAAVSLDCSATYPCKGIMLNDINLEYDAPDGPAISTCAHANGKATGTELPPSCLN
ncbi:exopolygalacturonase-like [Solanum lycopersicum]|uniref:Exopolygalacturonase-like n=1 Tax=Solanum lycopersicum TaxID=4081 RepID=A0A3Q7IF07_SOLLC|nr:exopolygalacturonase-like [Solanum lycopersicum]